MKPSIGQAISRVDGPLKVTGQARYAAEFFPDGLCYAALVESTICSGSIASIDAERAKEAPGALLVLTHENALKLPYVAAKERPAVEPVSGEQLHVLQNNTVLFCGQPIGLVVAKTQSQAEHAAGLVQVRYKQDEEALTTFDMIRKQPASEAAAKKGRGPASLHGDPDRAFAAARYRVDGTYLQPREHHNAMEPHATVAKWDGDTLTLWDKTQWVYGVADAVSRAFGLPTTSVRVINPFVGGAFGSGLRTWPHVILAAMASRMIQRPVRLELSRRELYYSVGYRPAAIQRVQLAADDEGRLQAVIQEAIGQTSTYEEFADATLDVPASTYASSNRRTRYDLVRMSVNSPTPMRGPGHSTGLIAQEIAMDELAGELGLDPVELRLRNFAETHPSKNLPWSSNELRECYRLGVERFGWNNRNPKPRSMRSGTNLLGMGMATALNPSPRYPAQASATYFANGTAVIRSATSDMGPGTYTAMTQVAADSLGLPIDKVRFELGDSALPKAEEHGGSTTTNSIGSAVQQVCASLRAGLNSLAQQHGTDPDAFATALRAAGLKQFDATADVKPGNEKQRFASYSFGAVFAEVHVDPDFNTVRVSRVLGVYDAGRIINPKLAHSQCIGGMVQGIGMALLEGADWDSRYGRVVNANIAEYLIPVCADIHTLEALFLPGLDTVTNPVGTKGLAELGLCGVAPAIANAVWHATGKRVRELPITPDRLFSDEANPSTVTEKKYARFPEPVRLRTCPGSSSARAAAYSLRR